MSEPRGAALGPGGEFDAIRGMLARLGDRAVDIGDDAAIVAMPRGERLVASVDACVENVHFRREWITPREIGHRAAVAALSDLAAMAAVPLGLLVAIAVPDAWRAALDEIAAGIADAARTAETHVLGGNTTRAGELSITTTVLGHAYAPLRRDAVRVGDLLYVTGRLGGPAAAVRAWTQGVVPRPEHRARFAAPAPRLREARWLADAGVTAAIDLSDGLAADAGHLAHASGAGVELSADVVPCIEGVDADSALASGEEYELLVASPTPLDAGAFERRFGLPLTAVGRAVAAAAPGVVVVRGGARVAPPSGHDHFSG